VFVVAFRPSWNVKVSLNNSSKPPGLEFTAFLSDTRLCFSGKPFTAIDMSTFTGERQNEGR
jgi:hypothetical protein